MLTTTEDATSVEVTMPETGSPTGARVVRWLCRPGERVEAGDPLCVVAWDGNTAEMDSPASGVLRMVCFGPGHRVATGIAMARIDLGVSAGAGRFA